jgi:hypothetical protein
VKPDRFDPEAAAEYAAAALWYTEHDVYLGPRSRSPTAAAGVLAQPNPAKVTERQNLASR